MSTLIDLPPPEQDFPRDLCRSGHCQVVSIGASSTCVFTEKSHRPAHLGHSKSVIGAGAVDCTYLSIFAGSRDNLSESNLNRLSLTRACKKSSGDCRCSPRRDGRGWWTMRASALRPGEEIVCWLQVICAGAGRSSSRVASCEGFFL